MKMAKDLVAVKILDLPGGGGSCSCGGSCGSTSSGPVFIATVMQKCTELKKALEENFPGQTRTEYVDISQSPEEKETEAGKLLVSKKYPSPLVLINGEARFAGSIQVNRVVEEVKKILNP
jgi:disulfide oxidoreductase YuzD